MDQVSDLVMGVQTWRPALLLCGLLLSPCAADPRLELSRVRAISAELHQFQGALVPQEWRLDPFSTPLPVGFPLELIAGRPIPDEVAAARLIIDPEEGLVLVVKGERLQPGDAHEEFRLIKLTREAAIWAGRSRVHMVAHGAAEASRRRP